MFDFTIKADATQALQTSRDVEASLERVLQKNEKLGESFAKAARVAAQAETSRLNAARTRAGEIDAQLSTMRGFEGLAAAIQKETAALERLRGPEREHAQNLQVIEGLYRKGAINVADYRAEVDRLNASLGRTKSGGIGEGVGQGSGINSIAAGGVAGITASLTAKALGSVGEIGEMSDAYTNLDNRLRKVTKSDEERATVLERVHEIANVTRSDLASTGETFVRLTNATREMGLTQSRTLGLTETISKAFAMSGASASEASAGMLQLSQAFSSGRLQGDEFRSLAEAVPDVLTLIAKELNVSTGKLKEMGSEGLITSDVLVRTFEKAKSQIDDGFAKTAPTLSQQWTVFKNDMTVVVGELLKSTDVMSTVGDAMKGLAGAITTVADAYKTLKSAKDAVGNFLVGDDSSGPRADTGSSKLDWVVDKFSNNAQRVIDPIGVRNIGGGSSKEDSDQMRRVMGQAVETQAQVIAMHAQFEALNNAYLSGFIKITDGIVEQNTRLDAANAGTNSKMQQLFGSTETVTRGAETETVHAAGAIEEAINTIGRTFGTLGDAAGLVFVNVFPSSLQVTIDKLGEVLEKMVDLSSAMNGIGAIGQAAGGFLADQLGSLLKRNKTLAEGGGKGMTDAEIAAEMSKKAPKGSAAKKKTDTWKDAYGDGGSTTLDLETILNGTDANIDATGSTLFAKFNSITVAAQGFLKELNDVDAVLLKMRQDNPWDDTGWKAAIGPDAVQFLSNISTALTTNADSTKAWANELRLLQAQTGSLSGQLGDGLDAFKKQMTDVSGDLQKTLSGAFGDLNQELVSFLTTGQADFDQFFKSLDQNLMNLAIKILEMKLMLAIFGGGTTSVFGTGATQSFQGLFGGAHADGGSFTVPGSGPPDSQNVMFKLTPGERVDFTPPGSNGGGGGGSTIVNQWDRRALLPVLNGVDGRRAIYNAVRSDPKSFRGALKP